MTTTDTRLIDTIKVIRSRIESFWQDAAYTAPEARGKAEARLLNDVYEDLMEGSNAGTLGYLCPECKTFIERDDWDNSVLTARAENPGDDGLGAGPACPVCPTPYTQNSTPVRASFTPREIEEPDDAE